MGQPDIQQAFSSVSVEGFDQIYQPEPMQAQTAPDLVQSDPMVESQTGPDLVQSDPVAEAQTGPELETQQDPSQGVSLEEASKILGLHIDTVRKRLQKGKIKGFKIADKFGDKWLVHKDELEKARTVPPYPTNPAQGAPDHIQAYPVDQAQTDPIVAIEIGPEQAPRLPEASIQADPERERLMLIIESQAHQLKAAGDVIMYLRNEVDDAKTQVKLLTDSQHKGGWWQRLRSLFVGR